MSLILTDRFIFKLILFIFTWHSIVIAVESHKPPRVKISSGLVEGAVISSPSGSDDVQTFYGIPYASAPIGELRFKRPLPYVKQWESPYNATQLPNTCMQPKLRDITGKGVWSPNTPVSEDCLYLNIWLPATRTPVGHKRSVLVWLHGGGNYGGSSTLDIYNGATLASRQDVIVVSAQYRLGPFGFLYLGSEEVPGNMGLLDQYMALKWVHENIGAFGGNTEEVTLMGESVGGAAVTFHLLSPLSKDLFKRAVIMSGAPTAPWSYRSTSQALEMSRNLANNVGCDSSEFDQDPVQIAKCLRGIDADKLTLTQLENVKRIMDLPLYPTVDGYFLPDTPENLQSDSFSNPAEIIIGNTANEGTFFLYYPYLKHFDLHKPSSIPYTLFKKLMRDIFSHYPEFERETILHHYTNWENVNDGYVNQQRLGDAVGDSWFTCPGRQFADKWSAFPGSSVYYYLFTHETSPSVTGTGKWMGVKHADEIAYFFGKPLSDTERYTPEEQILSDKIINLLSTFVKTGVPSKSWTKYSQENPVFLNFNGTVISEETSLLNGGPRPSACAFWNTYLPMLRQEFETRRNIVTRETKSKCGTHAGGYSIATKRLETETCEQ